MTALSELDQDALAELFNVGVGRAAAMLSTIVGAPVALSVPSVELKRKADIALESFTSASGRLAVVDQMFSGPIDAKAILLFSEHHVLEIVRDMIGSQINIQEFAEFEQEAMCELGNIILNACMSALADMLKTAFSSSLPNYLIATHQQLLEVVIHAPDEAHVLVLKIHMNIEHSPVEGHLIFILSSDSLNVLLAKVDACTQPGAGNG